MQKQPSSKRKFINAGQLKKSNYTLGSHELQRNQSQDAFVGNNANYDNDSYTDKRRVKQNNRVSSHNTSDHKLKLPEADYSQTVLTSDS